MTIKEIIDGLKFTVDMFLFDDVEGVMLTEPRNDLDKITIDACKGAIELLEQPRWIPVSERLPEEREWYLVVLKEKDTNFQLIPRVADYIGNGENKWRVIDEESMPQEYLNILECVAWMPLPEPYGAESEE